MLAGYNNEFTPVMNIPYEIIITFYEYPIRDHYNIWTRTQMHVDYFSIKSLKI